LAQLLNPSVYTGRTRLLILQPTPFCNIDCSYCYLPHRSSRERMSLETIGSAVRFVFNAGLAAPDFTIVWHAGEPLVLGTRWYRDAFAQVGQNAPRGQHIPHAIQTNGMLITDEWCEFFLQHSIRLGVSLDGPQWLHDRHRRTRSGGGTHAQVMKGIDLLRKHDVPFHVISVVTSATFDAADDLIAFYRREGLHDVGFNIEEIEGANKGSSLSQGNVRRQFERFFSTILTQAAAADPPIVIRERQDVLASLADLAFGQRRYNTQNEPFGFVTVAADGSLFTFSPELAGCTDSRYGNLSIGRLPGSSLDDVLANERFRLMWADIDAGVQACRQSCPYFNLCLGGAPSNKLAEHGDFRATETLHCKLVYQSLSDVILADLEARLLGGR
jgi:uncharacterized protein